MKKTNLGNKTVSLERETRRVYTILADKFLGDSLFVTKSDKEISDFIRKCVRSDNIAKGSFSEGLCEISAKLPRQKIIKTDQEFDDIITKVHNHLFLEGDKRYQAFRDERRAYYIQRKVYEAEGVYSFYLLPCDGKPLPFIPLGELLRLFVDKSKYTICHIASPRNPYYYHIISRFYHVSNFLNTCATVGDIVEVSSMSSSIKLLPANTYVFIAFEYEIASALAMIFTLLLTNPVPDIWIVVSFRDSDTHIVSYSMVNYGIFHK